MKKVVELACFDRVDDSESEMQSLLVGSEDKNYSKKFHLLRRIDVLRDSFSTLELFFHNFLFQSIFYSEMAYQAFLNYAEALVLSANEVDGTLTALNTLLTHMEQLGVFTWRAEVDFMDHLNSLQSYHQPLLDNMIACIQQDEVINSNALHPAVVYTVLIAATVTILAAPFVFTGFLAFFCVISAMFACIHVGPGSDVYDAMHAEDNRCESSYTDSIEKVTLARQQHGLFSYATAPAMSDDIKFTNRTLSAVVS